MLYVVAVAAALLQQVHFFSLHVVGAAAFCSRRLVAHVVSKQRCPPKGILLPDPGKGKAPHECRLPWCSAAAPFFRLASSIETYFHPAGVRFLPRRMLRRVHCLTLPTMLTCAIHASPRVIRAA